TIVYLAAIVIVLLVGVSVSFGQDGARWVPAAQGVFPPDAIAYGRDPDGRDLFVCRAAWAGGMALGEGSPALGGCQVPYRGRAITIATYEVLARPRASSAAALAVESVQPPAPGGARGRGFVHFPFSPTSASVSGENTTTRGFDEAGRPYVEN